MEKELSKTAIEKKRWQEQKLPTKWKFFCISHTFRGRRLMVWQRLGASKFNFKPEAQFTCTPLNRSDPGHDDRLVVSLSVPEALGVAVFVGVQ